MNFYQFLKYLQSKIGADCRVSVHLWKMTGMVNGLEVHIDWDNDFHYRFVVLEQMLDNEGLLEHLAEYISYDAVKRFTLAELGEE